MKKVSGFLAGLLLGIWLTGCATETAILPEQSLAPEVERPAESQALSGPSKPEPVRENLLSWPVRSRILSRGFSSTPKRSTASRKPKPHYGIDIPGKKGTPIFAAQSGLVAYTGQDFHGFGRLILIEGANGLATFYAHLSRFRVKQGQHVHAGDLIGEMGRTGHASGVHLHFEVRRDLAPVDPLLYLRE